MNLYNSKGKLFVVENTAFCGGGEGDNHHIIQPSLYNKQFIIKIYKKPSQTVQKKIEFMTSNNPFSNSQTMIQQSFAWPEEAIYDANRNFVGFRMMFIDNGETLEKMCTIGSNYTNSHLAKYNFINVDYFKHRLNLAYKICRAYNEFHTASAFKFVGVDIKPANIMIQKDGNNVTVIDLDTIQISDNNGNILFPSNNVVTPEYIPPEYQHTNIQVDFKQNWDLFSICVMLYQILFGLHPFTGSLISAKNGQTIQDLIANKYFPNGKNKNKFLTIPKPHKNFTILSPELQDFFIDAFEGNPDNRPTMKQMSDAILKEIQSKKPTFTLIPFIKKNPTNGNINSPNTPINNHNGNKNTQQYNPPVNTVLGGQRVTRVSPPVLPTFIPVATLTPLSTFTPITTGFSPVSKISLLSSQFTASSQMTPLTVRFIPLNSMSPTTAQLSTTSNLTPVTSLLLPLSKLTPVVCQLISLSKFNAPTQKKILLHKKHKRLPNKTLSNITQNIRNKIASIFW
jgi:serine/threonine protein kinase